MKTLVAVEACTHTKCVAVRMSDVTLTDVPRHVRRRPWRRNTKLQCQLVDSIDLGRCLQPPAHPYAAGLIVPGLARIGPPRAPWQFWQRKISDLPEITAPNVGSSPNAQCFCQPMLSNHAKLSLRLETFNIGVTPMTFIFSSRSFRVNGLPLNHQFQRTNRNHGHTLTFSSAGVEPTKKENSGMNQSADVWAAAP